MNQLRREGHPCGADFLAGFVSSLWHQQPCHANGDLCAGGHLWLCFLCAGVPLRFTTCLKSYRPYGAQLSHPTPSRNASLLPSWRTRIRHPPLYEGHSSHSIAYIISTLYPTANDYCRLQTFNQRLGLDKGCTFVA